MCCHDFPSAHHPRVACAVVLLCYCVVVCYCVLGCCAGEAGGFSLTLCCSSDTQVSFQCVSRPAEVVTRRRGGGTTTSSFPINKENTVLGSFGTLHSKLPNPNVFSFALRRRCKHRVCNAEAETHPTLWKQPIINMIFQLRRLITTCKNLA